LRRTLGRAGDCLSAILYSRMASSNWPRPARDARRLEWIAVLRDATQKILDTLFAAPSRSPLVVCDGVVDQRLGRLGLLRKPVATQTRKNRKKISTYRVTAPHGLNATLCRCCRGFAGAPLPASRAGKSCSPGRAEKDFPRLSTRLGLAGPRRVSTFQRSIHAIKKGGELDAQFAPHMGRVVLALVHVSGRGLDDSFALVCAC